MSQEKNYDTDIFLSSKKVNKKINIKIDKSIVESIKEIKSESNINHLTSENKQSEIDIIEIYFNSSMKQDFDSLEKIIINKKFDLFFLDNFWRGD